VEEPLNGGKDEGGASRPEDVGEELVEFSEDILGWMELKDQRGNI
jgi:hypothetical protein